MAAKKLAIPAENAIHFAPSAEGVFRIELRYQSAQGSSSQFECEIGKVA